MAELSEERVAYDLARKIIAQEYDYNDPKDKFREYCLDLYVECLNVTTKLADINENQKIMQSGKECVAYDLTEKITAQEYDYNEPKVEFRQYYLVLYAECLEATRNDRNCNMQIEVEFV